MSFTEELYRAARPIWDAQVEHPFVQGITDGSLDEEIFKRWILQDYLYLKEFARVFAWAAAKADRLESMGWYARMLELTLDTEMALHRQYAARFGLSVDDLENQEMWPTTRAYTDFLVRTAADGDLADLLAALLPCAWGYVHIAQRISSGSRPSDQRYADWIDQYTAEEFAEAAAWLRRELERLSEGATDQKKKRLTGLFLQSSRYEWQFWEMCWKEEHVPV